MKHFITAITCLLLAGLYRPLSGSAQSLTGTVFEDVNYGGGAGRAYATANTSAIASGFATGSIRRPGARVELYSASGSFLTATTTDANGQYTFGGLTSGAGYTVRVVSSTVSSGRPGATGGLLPVQTFRTSSGAADAQRVGGENPAAADGAANTGSVVVTSTTIGNNINLAFTGLTSATGVDNTLFLDNVQVLQTGTPLATNPIQNPDFENGTLTTFGGTYQYNPIPASTFGWTFNSTSGIQANNSAFTPPNTTSNVRAGLIQSTSAGDGAISQAFNLPAGTYTISFAAANRQSGGLQRINVTVNGFQVLANLQAVANSYSTYTTQAFTVGTASTGGQTLSSLSAQSIAPVTATLLPITGLDFGFNFDVVTNTNDAGQGSVRQFLLNSNALTNASLAQQGQTAGQETSIFMIPNGVAGSGAPQGLQRTPAAASGLNAGSSPNTWAQLQVLSALPTVTDANTTLDATTQTTNVQDSNTGLVGTGGTVGTDARPLPQVNRPEVEIYGVNTLNNVLRVAASGAVLRGLALHGAGANTNGTVTLTGAQNFLVEKCMLGISALTIADPNALQANTYSANYNLQILGVSQGTVRNNLVAYASSSGLIYNGTAGSGMVSVTSNEFVQNGYRISGGDNITAGDNGVANGTGPLRIRANLIRSANSDGVQFEIGSLNTNVVTNNTFFDNGNGGLTIARSQLEGSAILYLQRTGGKTSSSNDSIAYNVINQSQASGIVVGYGQRGVIIARNSIFFNGTPFNSPTGSNLGIDIIPQSGFYVGSGNTVGARDYGNGDGVTPNNGPTSVSTAYGNAGMNYPIITYARVSALASTTVSVGGYVGSAPGQTAFAGAVVDFYAADNVPANNGGQVLAGDGRKVAHGEGRSYVGSLTADANGNFAGTLTIPANTPPNVGPASSGLITATATLVSTSSNYGTSEFSPNVPIIITADVYATITGASGGVNAGTTGTFTVQFGNQSGTGPVQADGVTAQVQLPAGLTGVTATNGGTYNSTTGIISYSGYTGAAANNFPSGSSFSSTISYPQPVTGLVTASATIATTTNEGGLLANNSATAANPTNLLYDVTTTVAGPASAVAGAQVSYNVTTLNPVNAAFPSPAPFVTQMVSVPAGASNVYVTGGGVVSGSMAAGYTVTFPTLAALAPGQSLTNTVSFTAPAGSTYNVTGTVSTAPADGNSGNNTSTATTTTPSAASGSPANVYVKISPASSTVALNGAVSLAVEQGNYGPGAAAGLQTTVLLPPGLPTSGASAPTLTGYSLSSSTATTATYSNGTLTATYSTTSGLFTLPAVTGSQPSGTTGTAANNYTLGYVATQAGVFPATATVSSTTPDPVLGDNVASAEVTVNPGVADLAITIIGPTLVAGGETLTYTVTTTNNGPADAQGVGQTVSILAGLPLTGPTAVRLNGAAPTSVSGPVATYGSGPGAATYNTLTGVVTFPAAGLPQLAVGSAVSSTVTYVAPANGNTVLTNTAAVQSSSLDMNLANNSASVAAPLQPVADVQVSISAAGFITTNASGGNPVLFGVTTLNNGPNIAPSTVTTVVLPTSLPISGTGPEVVRINGQLPSSVSNGVATYNFPDGSSATYDSRTSLNSSTPGRVTFSAQTNLPPSGSGVGATIGFVVPTGYIGQLVATASVAVSGILDNDQSNNLALAQPVLGTANGSNDVSTTVTASASTVTAGQPLTLTVTSNPGGGASGVLQALQLPAGLTSNGGTVTVSGGPSGSVVTGGTLSPNYDNTSGLLTFPAILNLTAATSYSVVISRVPGQGPLVATASITANELDTNPANNVAIASVAITPAAALGVVVTGPTTAPTGSVVTYLLAATNNGPTTTTGTTQTVTIPAGVMAYSLNGGPLVTVSGSGPTTIALNVPTTLVAGAANTVTSTISFVAPGNAGSSLAVSSSLSATGPASPATATGSQTTALISPAPIAYNVVNTLTSPEGNTAQAALALSPLQAQAQGLSSLNGTAPFVVLSLPLASQGVLSLAGSPVAVGQSLTTAQAGQLQFLPATGFVGNAPFTFQAYDNNNLRSNVARYLIPVGSDNASVYTATPSKGGTVAYQNNDVIAYVIDPNGAVYNGTGQIYQPTGPNAGQSATGTVNNGVQATTTTGTFTSTSVPAITSLSLLGLTYNPATGQITVLDRTKLKAGTYTVSMTTTDLRGGITTQPVTFTIGANPLPVTLTEFTAKAVRNLDAALAWATASELNNDHFDVERSFDGATYARIGQVAGSGSTTAAHTYAFADAGVGRAATGPVYYRLRQVDATGTSSYSPVRTISFGAAAPSLAVYPSPAASSTTLDLSLLPAGTYQVTLLDATGRLVRHFDAAGGMLHSLDVRDLATGTYFVHLAGTSATGQALNLSQHLTKE